MLSYVFDNKKIGRKDIEKVCIEALNLHVIRDKENEVLLANDLINVLVKRKYTYVMLSNENVNIRDLERIF